MPVDCERPRAGPLLRSFAQPFADWLAGQSLVSRAAWFRAEAAADLDAHVDYLREHGDKARQFVDAAEKTVTLIAFYPRMGKPWNPPWIRVFPVRGFPKYLIQIRIN